MADDPENQELPDPTHEELDAVLHVIMAQWRFGKAGYRRCVRQRDNSHYAAICALVGNPVEREGYLGIAHNQEQPELTLEWLVTETFAGRFPYTVTEAARARLAAG